MEGNHNPLDWGREGKICATLSKKYGADFLLWVNPPEDYKVNSLTFYYSVLGRNHLSDQLVEYSKKNRTPSPEKPEIVLSETKIGEDTITTFKPKTLKEFLNYGKIIAARQNTNGQTAGKETNDSNGADASLSETE
jgi:hypothetical protein